MSRKSRRTSNVARRRSQPRKESIKAYGNAIVPLIAVKIFEMINKIEGYEQQTTL